MTPIQPQQERSRESLARILGATRTLLDDRVFSAITVSDIAREAGVSTGLLYSRFKSKEEILPELLREFMAETLTAFEDQLDPDGTESMSVEERVEILVERVRDMSRGSLGLLRAATARRVLDPDVRTADEVRLSAEIRSKARDWLDPAREEVAREDPARALDFVNWTIFLAAQLAPMITREEDDLNALLKELSAAMTLYLTAPSGRSHTRRGE